METTYVYAGSLGGWDDNCTGPVTFTIDADLVLSGEGDCQFEAWGMGFLIEGQQTDTAIDGLLISDNALGRVETPFTGRATRPRSRSHSTRSTRRTASPSSCWAPSR